MTFGTFREALSSACLGSLVATGALAGQSVSAQAPGVPPIPTLTAQQAQEDFDVLRRALQEAHGGFDRFSPKADLDRRFDGIRTRLDRSMTTLTFAGILAETVAEIRDGHARLELDSVTSAVLAGALVLPLRVVFEGHRLVVLNNDSPPDSTIRPGMEIVAINGHSTAALISTLLPKVPGDGFIETGRYYNLARQFSQLFWLHVEQATSYTVTAEDEAGHRVTTTLPGLFEADRRATINPVNSLITEQITRLEGPAGLITLAFIDDSAVAHLRIRGFDGQAFPEHLDSAFRTLETLHTTALILDLRGNRGGVDEYGALLVSYFVEEPFRYFDHIWVATIAPSFATWLPRTFDAMRTGTVPDPDGGFRVLPSLHPGVGQQVPAGRPFRGRLVVLIDGGTFSTATDVAAQLRSRGRALFVGEETAGTYEGNTSGLNALIVLPHSGLRLKVMMYGYWNAVTPPATVGRGVIPDHVVIRRVGDLLQGTDAVLERGVTLGK